MRAQNKMNNDESPGSRPRRQRTLLRGLLQREGCSVPVEIRIRNLSSGGLMAGCAESIERGDPVSVTLREIGEVAGRVVWSGEDGIGIAFDEPIDPHLALQTTRPQQTQRFIPPVDPGRRPGLRSR